MNEIDHFMPILMKKEEEAEMTPLVSHGSAHFLWIKHNNLYCIRSYICCGSWKISVKSSRVSRFYNPAEGYGISSELCEMWVSHLCSVSDSVSPQSVSQHVEKTHTPSVWLVSQTCTLLIQHHIAVPPDAWSLQPSRSGSSFSLLTFHAVLSRCLDFSDSEQFVVYFNTTVDVIS